MYNVYSFYYGNTKNNWGALYVLGVGIFGVVLSEADTAPASRKSLFLAK